VHGCVVMRICMRIQPAFGLITVYTYRRGTDHFMH